MPNMFMLVAIIVFTVTNGNTFHFLVVMCSSLHDYYKKDNFKGLVQNYCNYLILYKKNTEVLHQALKI